MFITSRESAIFPESVPLPIHPEPIPRWFPARGLPSPTMRVRGLSVSRAYISPEKPQVKANFPVLLGFMGVFWNWRQVGVEDKSIYSGIDATKHN
jgi:hypothetical protein